MGKIMHWYFVAGKIASKLLLYSFYVGIITTVLILTVPQFKLNQIDFKTSFSSPLLMAQAAVGILFFASWGIDGVILVLFCIFIWPEIIIELILKHRAMKIVKERGKITVPALAGELRIREDDFGILIKNWTAAGGYKLSSTNLTGKKLSLNLIANPREVTWVGK
jgi:hypothetical protein